MAPKKSSKKKTVKTFATPVRNRLPKSLRGLEENLIKDSLKRFFIDEDLLDEDGNEASAVDFGVDVRYVHNTIRGFPSDPLNYWNEGLLLRGNEGPEPRPVGWRELGSLPGEHSEAVYRIQSVDEFGNKYWHLPTNKFDVDSLLPHYYNGPHDDYHFEWMWMVNSNVVGYVRLQNFVPMRRRVPHYLASPRDFYDSLETDIRRGFNECYFKLDQAKKFMEDDDGRDPRAHLTSEGKSVHLNWTPLRRRLGHLFNGGRIDSTATMAAFPPITNFIDPTLPVDDRARPSSYARGRTLLPDGTPCLDHRLPGHTPMDGTNAYPLEPARNIWLNSGARSQLERFLRHLNDTAKDAFISRLTQEVSPFSLIKKLGPAPGCDFSEEESDMDSGTDLGCSFIKSTNQLVPPSMNNQDPPSSPRLIIDETPLPPPSSPQTPDGERHSSLADEYSNNSSLPSDPGSIIDYSTEPLPDVSTIPLPPTPKTSGTAGQVKPVTLSEIREAFRVKQLSQSPADSPASPMTPMTEASKASSTPSSRTLRSSDRSDDESPSILRGDNTANHTFGSSISVEAEVNGLLNDIRARLDAKTPGSSSHLSSPRTPASPGLPSTSTSSSDTGTSPDSSFDEIDLVTRALQREVLESATSRKRKSSDDYGGSPAKRIRVDTFPNTFHTDLSPVDHHLNTAALGSTSSGAGTFPFPAAANLDFEQLAMQQIAEFLVPNAKNNYAQLLKLVTRTCAGNTVLERARSALLMILRCFKKLYLPPNAIPMIGFQEDPGLGNFVMEILNDVIDKLIRKTEDARLAECDKRSTSAGFRPSMYVWESPSCRRERCASTPGSLEVYSPTNSPLSDLSPPASASTPLSPTPTNPGPSPPRSTPVARCLRSGCADRSRCLVSTPISPRIAHTCSIANDVFEAIPETPSLEFSSLPNDANLSPVMEENETSTVDGGNTFAE